MKNEPKVLVYLTGLPQVSGLTSNHYLPGAFADHLTSYGGQVPDSVQMSALRWLEAGATASYGTVIKPCNFAEKFPAAGVLLEHVVRGESVLEAAWLSVQMPGEGLFIGEPLAAPFGRRGEHFDSLTNSLSLETTELTPGHSYLVEHAPTAQGPWLPAMSVPMTANYRSTVITIAHVDAGFYRLTEPR